MARERLDAVGAFGFDGAFSGSLPAVRERPHQAWVQISGGLQLRLRVLHRAERARARAEPPAGEVVAEVEALAADGVREVTLLGQNVNSYGRDLPREGRATFAELLREAAAVDGIWRVRYTSPHPKDMRDDVIAAMAECPRSASTSTCRPVGLDPGPEGDAADLLPRALPRPGGAASRGDPGPVADDGPDRRLPGRDGGGLRPDARARGGGAATTPPTPSSTRPGPGPRPTTGWRTTSPPMPSASGSAGSWRWCSAPPPSGRRASWARPARPSSRGRRRTDPSRLRGRLSQNIAVNFTGTAEPGTLARVRIEAATSTTLTGREARVGPEVAVPA